MTSFCLLNLVLIHRLSKFNNFIFLISGVLFVINRISLSPDANTPEFPVRGHANRARVKEILRRCLSKCIQLMNGRAEELAAKMNSIDPK